MNKEINHLDKEIDQVVDEANQVANEENTPIAQVLTGYFDLLNSIE